MGKIAISYPNRLASVASYTGQGWLAALPPSNLETRQLAQVTRFTGTSAPMWVDAAAAVDVGVAALVNHNLGTTGTWRLRGYSSDPRPRVDRDTRQSTLDLNFAERAPASGTLATVRSGSATYVDSSKVLQTAGANTLRYHHDIQTGERLGLLCEAATTNYCLWNRDGSNAAWTKSNATAAKTSTGVDGASNSCTRLTATSSTGRISQVVTPGVANVYCLFSVYIRRVTGTGNVKLTCNNFTNTTTVSVPSSGWQRFDLYFASTSVTLGIQLDTNGDAIDFDYAQLELVTNSVVYVEPSTPIATTSGSAARGDDAITYTFAAAEQPPLAAGSMVMEFLWQNPGNGGASGVGSIVGSLKKSGTGVVELVRTFGSVTQIQTRYAASSLLAGTVNTDGTATAVGASWTASTLTVAYSGAASSNTAATMDTNGATSIVFDADENSATRCAFIIKRITFYDTTTAGASLTTFTSAFTAPTAGYDSGSLDAWPSAWVSGTTAEERSGVTGLSLHVPTATQSYRYWRIDLTDSTATYLQFGRLFFGSRWQPGINAVVGSSIGYAARASVVETDSGAEYFVSRSTPRVVRLDFDLLDESEAMADLLEMQRQLGNTGELICQWSTADARYMPARTVLGRLKELTPLTNVYANYWTTSLEIKELL